jgi:hypothetical protein
VKTGPVELLGREIIARKHPMWPHIPTGETIDINGRMDQRGVRYLGVARKYTNGEWVVLADCGVLALVVVKLSFEDEVPIVPPPRGVNLSLTIEDGERT